MLVIEGMNMIDRRKQIEVVIHAQETLWKMRWMGTRQGAGVKERDSSAMLPDSDQNTQDK